MIIWSAEPEMTRSTAAKDIADTEFNVTLDTTGGGNFDTTADASDRFIAVEIYGNALDNKIIGGWRYDTLHGRAGNDLLFGKFGNNKIFGDAGNDTLRGDMGADTFVYRKFDGDDVIRDFADDDLLQITDAFKTSYDSATNEVIFNTRQGSVTLRDFTATTFNINGYDYGISGTKLVKK